MATPTKLLAGIATLGTLAMFVPMATADCHPGCTGEDVLEEVGKAACMLDPCPTPDHAHPTSVGAAGSSSVGFVGIAAGALVSALALVFRQRHA